MSKNKILLLGLIIVVMFGILSPAAKVGAAEPLGNCRSNGVTYPNTTESTCKASSASAVWVAYYSFLAPLPCPKGTEGCDANGTLSSFDPTSDANGKNTQLGKYLNLMITIVIGLAAVMAVVMIVIGGIEYMTTELISSKEAGKEKITGALLGLLLALGSYAILNTINPALLKSNLDVEQAVVTVSPKDIITVNSNGQVSAGDGGPINPASIGTSCDARTIMSAAQSAGNNITAGQAAAFACIITPESGCKSVKNYNWGGGSSAYGPYQILLQTNSSCFENQACYAAVGITGNLGCSTGFLNGNPIAGSAAAAQCMKAADNFACSTGAAACVLKKQGFSAWTADPRNSKQKACINKYK